MRALTTLSKPTSPISRVSRGCLCPTTRALSEVNPVLHDLGTVDYLVVGAGAASMAFVDTLLKQQPTLKVAIIDKNDQPGGHWVNAYGFVRLHQPSVVYGVESKLLEGRWWKHFLGLQLPWKHRASKQEILDYFSSVLEGWVSENGAMFFGGCSYDVEQRLQCGDERTEVHHFASLNGSATYRMQVRHKLINGVMMECKIPKTTPLTIPVAPAANVVTVNQLDECKASKYVVLGAGKTGMDAVIHLQSVKGVDPSDITWIIPADVWMLNRTKADPTAYVNELLKQRGDKEATADALYEQGLFVRLDPSVRPTRYRFPMIGEDELVLLRNVTDVVRRGRATSIEVRDDGKPTIDFSDGAPPEVVMSHTRNVAFVHCAAPGPFNGAERWDIFESDRVLNLAMLYAPPVSISTSCLAALESARLKGTLDLALGRRIVGKTASENDILNSLFQNFKHSPDGRPYDSLHSVSNLAHFISLLDEDPGVGARFLKSNRLSMYSIPNMKMGIYENLERIAEDHEALQLTELELEDICLVTSKLVALRGV